MSEHPTAADLDRFGQGTLGPEERRTLLSHLLRRCHRCCHAVAQHWGLEVAGIPAESAGDEYDSVLDRALAAASRMVAPREEACATLSALLSDDGREARHQAPRLPRLQGLPRLRALIETARSLRHDDPQATLRFAKLARSAADRLRMRDLGRATVADLRALAWAELSSGYRICNELGRADQAINRAIHWCERGSMQDLLLARIADLLASLLAYQRRFSEARELAAEVHRIHAERGDRHLAGRALVSQGAMWLWEGHPRQAIPLLGKGLSLLESKRDPHLMVQTVWNMIWALADLGKFRSARQYLWRARLVFEGVIQPHRLRWLEGRILAGLGDAARAEAAFQQARAGFVEQGQVYPAALVGLDLAALWARQHRLKDVFELTEEMIVTFRSLRIAREAIGVLLVLKQACRYGGQVLRLIDLTAEMIENLERQPPRPRPFAASPPPAPPGPRRAR